MSSLRLFSLASLIILVADADEVIHSIVPEGTVNAVAVDSRGKTLIAAATSEEGSAAAGLSVWSLDTGKMTKQLQGHTGGATAAGFAANGRRAATAGKDGTVIIWYPNTWRTAATLRGHKAEVTALSFNPAGNQVATADAEGQLIIWDAFGLRKRFAFPVSESPVRALTYQTGKNVIATGDDNGVIRIGHVEIQT